MMIQRLISIIVLVAFLNCLLGCSSTTRISISEIKPPPKGKIVKIILKTGEEIEFDSGGGKIDTANNIVKGYAKDPKLHGTLVETKYEDIAQVHFKQFSFSKNLILIGGLCILGLVAFIIWDYLSMIDS